MTATGRRGEAAALWGPGGFVALLAGYVALHFVLRLALSETIGTDYVAEAIFAQSLEWSYYPRQPPLYTWLQWALFQAFGVGVFSIALMKYALLTLTYVFLYLSARRIFADPRLQMLSAFSPLLIYAVGWGAHVGFTNTALLAFACVATFYALVRLLETGATAAYLGLGAALGVGLLSKYGYAVFAISLLAAALAQEGPRRRLLERRMLLAVGLAAAIVLPYLAWGFEGTGAFETVFRQTMKEGGGVPYVEGVASGLATLLKAVVMFLSPLWLVLFLIFPRAIMPGVSATQAAGTPQSAAPGGAGVDARRLLEHFFLIAFAIVLLGVLGAGITYFTSRWMHPLLLLFPIYFFCRVRDSGFGRGQVRRYSVTLLAFVALVVVFRVAQAAIGPPLCNKCRLAMPYPVLTQQIADRGFATGTIVAADEHIAGNFRVRFPGSRVVSVTYPFYIPPPRPARAAE
ncbi:MAG: glycosyltransferase family 39 protein, partial [Alphaproteobacteria bacterium]